jgi:hypothetical protein
MSKRKQPVKKVKPDVKREAEIQKRLEILQLRKISTRFPEDLREKNKE